MTSDACTLLWRHNGPDGVSTHQPHDCLHKCLFRRISKKTPKLCVTGLCTVNSPVTGEWPVTRKMFPFDDVMMMYASEIGYWCELKKTLFVVNGRETWNQNQYIELFHQGNVFKNVCIYLPIWQRAHFASDFSRHNSNSIEISCDHDRIKFFHIRKNIAITVLELGWEQTRICITLELWRKSLVMTTSSNGNIFRD